MKSTKGWMGLVVFVVCLWVAVVATYAKHGGLMGIGSVPFPEQGTSCSSSSSSSHVE